MNSLNKLIKYFNKTAENQEKSEDIIKYNLPKYVSVKKTLKNNEIEGFIRGLKEF